VAKGAKTKKNEGKRASAPSSEASIVYGNAVEDENASSPVSHGAHRLEPSKALRRGDRVLFLTIFRCVLDVLAEIVTKETADGAAEMPVTKKAVGAPSTV
jgi:hypothetical protein